MGIVNQRLILNGMFAARNGSDPVARALEARGRQALEGMPIALQALPRSEVPLVPFELVGIAALRSLGENAAPAVSGGKAEPNAAAATDGVLSLDALVTDIARSGRGVIMAMGKGGVGKTTSDLGGSDTGARGRPAAARPRPGRHHALCVGREPEPHAACGPRPGADESPAAGAPLHRRGARAGDAGCAHTLG